MGESSSTSNHGMPLAGEIQVSRRLPTGVEESIENSKSHWSEVREFDCGHEVAEVSNVELFQTLQRHPTWGGFFKTFGEGEDTYGTLVMGEKFAEGGQAELYDVRIEWLNQAMREQDLRLGLEWVLKVFKKGTSLQYLQALWPQGMLHYIANSHTKDKPSTVRLHSDVVGGTLLEDGRFAFLMVKERVDLRSLIDYRRSDRNMGPLTREHTMEAMYEIAFGMKQLHDRNIVHRDLKASNVLISKNLNCHIADYECSVGVVGTGFFRAPEILQACKNRTVSSKVDLFTKAADVYGYGMICYEILTGKLPFEGHPLNDYDLVIKGGRPEVPQYVDGWIRKLLNQCWHSNPASRPSFKGILQVLVANSSVCLERKLGMELNELKVWETFKESQGSWLMLEKFRSFGRKLLIHLSYRVRKIRLHCVNRL